MVIVDGQTPARLTFGPLELVDVPAEVDVAGAALLDDEEDDELLPQALTARAATAAAEARAVNRIRLCIVSFVVMGDVRDSGRSEPIS
jgi:hypothetical protein